MNKEDEYIAQIKNLTMERDRVQLIRDIALVILNESFNREQLQKIVNLLKAMGKWQE